MSFQVTGKIVHIGHVEGGISQRTGYQWVKQVFAIEQDCKERWRIPFELMGQHVEETTLIQGQEVDVFFDIDGREYQGRWYSTNRAFLVRVHQENSPGQQLADRAIQLAQEKRL